MDNGVWDGGLKVKPVLYLLYLALEQPGGPKEELENVTGEWDFLNNLLSLQLAVKITVGN